MVLNHVAQRAGCFVVTAPTAHANRLGICDLNVIDVLTIPERLENAVGKTKDQQILYRLFAEIVIDTINLTFVKD